LANALAAYGIYIGQTLSPSGLAPFYPYSPPGRLNWQAAAGTTAFVGISGLVLWRRRPEPYLLTGWLWFLGTLVPVLGLVQVGGQAYADRYTYIPQVGLLVAAVWALDGRVHAPAPRRLLVAASLAAVALAAILSWQQIGYWHDSVSLWEHTLRVTADNAVAHNNLALAYAGDGRLAEAVEQVRRAVRVDPGKGLYQNNLAQLLDRQGHPDEAMSHYQRALELEPDSAAYHNDLGTALEHLGRNGEALRQYRTAVRLDPRMAEARVNLGRLLYSEGHVSEAATQFAEAARLKGHLAVAHHNLGVILQDQGQRTAAIARFRRAVELEPDNALYRQHLNEALRH
jgi:tetratricopeptide (TPR) repeat protein